MSEGPLYGLSQVCCDLNFQPHPQTISPNMMIRSPTPPAAFEPAPDRSVRIGARHMRPSLQSKSQPCESSRWRLSTQGPSIPQSKVIFGRFRQLLAINAHKMALKTRKRLQERAWDTPTQGLLWEPAGWVSLHRTNPRQSAASAPEPACTVNVGRVWHLRSAFNKSTGRGGSRS